MTDKRRGICPVCKRFTTDLDAHKGYHDKKKEIRERDGEFKPMFIDE